MSLINEGQSIRQASAVLGFPDTTVRRHLHAAEEGRHVPPPGAAASLPPALEQEFVEIIRMAAESGFGICRSELKSFVADVVNRHLNTDTEIGNYLRQHCRFVNGAPSDKWVTRFLKKHFLTLLKVAPLEMSRFKAESDPVVING